MKNILIPTNYNPDSFEAMRMAADFRKSVNPRITMLSTTGVSDSISELLFPQNWASFDPAKQRSLFETWSNYARKEGMTSLNVSQHHQYGLSRPIVGQILERYEIDLVLVPFSFHDSKVTIERTLLSLLRESKIPVMLLPAHSDYSSEIHRGLYLGDKPMMPRSPVSDFPFHIIDQSMIPKEEAKSVKAVIKKLRINLIVLAKGKERSASEPLKEYGLPVLTI